MEASELSSIRKYVSASKTIDINDKTNIFNCNDLLSIKHYMEAARTINMNDKTRILNAINIFFLTNCEHEIITDYIDITPEKGHNIKYCSKCDITFNS
jgi:RNase P subunit RPR2